MALKISVATFFAGSPNGIPTRIDKGDALPADHPIVKANPTAFVTPDEWAQARSRFAVEAATAAPGELRNVKKPR